MNIVNISIYLPSHYSVMVTLIVTNYIGVKSVDEYYAEISQSGGKMAMSKKNRSRNRLFYYMS